MPRLPPWIRAPLRTDRCFPRVHGVVAELDLHTVCLSAKCPNRHECWNRGTATWMILGGTCTRRCGFCGVDRGRPAAPDPREPDRVARASAAMGLRHVVVTSVTRDDLPDGGASVFAETVGTIRRALPDATIEVLTPDFKGRPDAVQAVLAAKPDVFAHNLETVERLQGEVRPGAGYARSLAVLREAAGRPGIAVKSGLMVGLGETDEELFRAMADLREAGCRLLTIGQYLAPAADRLPVRRFVEPARFEEYARRAREAGFAGVASAPLVRSSYRAGELLAAAGR